MKRFYSSPKASITFFRIVFLLLLWLYSITVSGQKLTIAGEIMDSSFKFLPSANIYLISPERIITDFTTSDLNGKFSFSIADSNINKIRWIEASFSGYIPQRQNISRTSRYYKFVLLSDTTMLKEVVVRNSPPINTMGDTLRYDVNKFADKNDRSIGDVLKRMPGISINDDDGSIYFNGKKVSNLYIDGDDLMSGKYRMATRAINKEMIQSVDIIKNHQPISVLSEKIFSDATALNLVLKDPNSFRVSGNADLGGGTSRQYELSLTPIILNQKVKAVDNISINNVGINYNNDLKTIGLPNLVSDIKSEPPKKDLSLATKIPSELPQQDYYFNKSSILNLNNIFKTKDNIQFKLNFQALKDIDQGTYYGRTNNYLSGDTILFEEAQNFRNSPEKIYGMLNVMMNKKKYFFSNTTSINFFNEHNTGTMKFNDSVFNQQVGKKLMAVSNDLNWIPSLGRRNMGEFRWNINYNENSQYLTIGDGFYSQIPQQPSHYNQVMQYLKLPTLSSNLYFNYKIPGKIINHTYQIGYISELNKLHSNLEFADNLTAVSYAGDAGNDLTWRKSNVYISSNYQINFKKLKTFVNLPLIYQDIHFYQKEYQLDQSNKKILFQPEVNLIYSFKNGHSLNALFRNNNMFGDITGVYRGGILEDYRHFAANQAGLKEARKQTISMVYNSQNTIKMLFANIGFDYNYTKAKTLSNIQISSDLQTNFNLPFENSQKDFSIRGGVSKYFFKLKSSLSLQSSLMKTSMITSVNNTPLPFVDNSYNANLSFARKFFEKLTFTYTPIVVWSNSSSKDDNSGYSFAVNAFRIHQLFSLDISPIEKLNFKLMARQNYNKQSGNLPLRYFFMDAAALYKGIKKCDISISVTNVFNIKEFIFYNSNSYQFITEKFTLRKRMGMLRFNYYF